MHDGWFCISAPPLGAGSPAGTRLLSSCPNLGALALSIRQVHDPRLCSRVDPPAPIRLPAPGSPLVESDNPERPGAAVRASGFVAPLPRTWRPQRRPSDRPSCRRRAIPLPRQRSPSPRRRRDPLSDVWIARGRRRRTSAPPRKGSRSPLGAGRVHRRRKTHQPGPRRTSASPRQRSSAPCLGWRALRRHSDPRGSVGDSCRANRACPGGSLSEDDPPGGRKQDYRPWVAGIIGAGRSWTAWTISVLSIPRK
jgi:hypothetical protein